MQTEITAINHDLKKEVGQIEKRVREFIRIRMRNRILKRMGLAAMIFSGFLSLVALAVR